MDQQEEPPQRDLPLMCSTKSKPSAPADRSSSKNGKTSKAASSAFRFVVVEHPDELRDRQQMRENRMHVMHDYLDKERRRPGSLDSRVNAAGKKRKPPAESNKPAVQNATQSQLHDAVSQSNSSQRTTPESSRNDETSDKENTGRSGSRRQHAKNSHPRMTMKKLNQFPHYGRSLVSGIGGSWANSAYMRTTMEDIPAGPGARLEPFGTWPSLIDPSLDVNVLKWSCSQRFGSESMSANYIPALLRARHAFLSTLCISSAYDAVMTRALIPTNVQASYKNIDRWKIKRDVIAMVAGVMGDPDMQAADETILAVLHLLNSDIMGCDDRDMLVHQDGLSKMVQQRGGLEMLGVGGELAGVLTITNYMIAATRELTPHDVYVRFASKMDTRIPAAPQVLPESPIYSRPEGYKTVCKVVSPSSPTYELLDALRRMTTKFFLENASTSTPTSSQTSDHHRATTPQNATIETLAQQIFASPPAESLEFDGMNERYTYETIRLTGTVYAYALWNKLPFSIAAARFTRADSPFNPTDISGNVHQPPSLPIQIKNALLRTDLSYCWDHMGGVLFWIALVGGAAANPGPFADDLRQGEEEDARKFLAAVAVRCCIVLSFQYPFAVLETLKRVVLLETALASAATSVSVSGTTASVDGYFGDLEGWVDAGDDTAWMPGMFGPAEATHLQKGFADFSEEFWSV